MTSFYERIQNREFNTKLPFPSKPKAASELTARPLELSPENLAKLPRLKAEYDLALAEYNAAKAEFHADQARLSAQFELEAIAEVGLEGHPKAAKAFELAYDRGHSGGYMEVFIELQTFAELLLDT